MPCTHGVDKDVSVEQALFEDDLQQLYRLEYQEPTIVNDSYNIVLSEFFTHMAVDPVSEW